MFKVIPEFEVSHSFPLTYMAKGIIHYGHCPRWQPAKPESCFIHPIRFYLSHDQSWAEQLEL